MGYSAVPNTLTLAILGSLSVAGAVAGVQLGRATVGDINPAQFGRGEESRFYADLAPNRPDWAQVTAAEYQQASAAPPPAAAPGGCVGCASWPIDPRPVHDPAIDRALSAAWREARAPAPEPVRYVRTVVYEEPRADPVRERIRRYASYPITRDEVPPPPDPEDLPDEGDAATQ